MSNSSWFKETPNWVWLSFLPTFGALALVYAGRKSNTPAWIYLGMGTFVFAIIVASTKIAAFVWLFQVAAAFSIKNKFILKTQPHSFAALQDVKTCHLIAEVQDKIDINTCSKHDIVRRLGIPIVYANDIEAMRNDGYLFTHLEELSEIAGLPESYLNRLEPLVTFSYDYRKEIQASWQRLNSLSAQQLVQLGLDATVAQTIVKERQSRGSYCSVADVKKRTGLPLTTYQFLI